MSEYEERVQQRRQHAGAKKLVSRCHCGKVRARHTISEANQCKREQETQTTVRKMTAREISEMQVRKI